MKCMHKNIVADKMICGICGADVFAELVNEHEDLMHENIDLCAKLDAAEQKNVFYKCRMIDINNFGIEVIADRNELLKKIEELKQQVAELKGES